MRNLKKLLAVVLAVTVMLSVMATVAFADTSSAISADATTCKTLGMLVGTDASGVTADYTATQPTRIQAAMLLLRLKGLDKNALAYTGTDNFSDVTNPYWMPVAAYLKAHPEVGFEGIGNNMLDPYSTIDAKSYYKVMLVALGYKYNTDFTWDNVLDKAAAVGLTKVANVSNFTIDNLATATVEALKAKLADGSKTLTDDLIAKGAFTQDQAQAAGLVAAASALKVNSVTAKNSSTLTVAFSKAVADDVTQATFSVVCTDTNGNKITISTTPTWSADKTSVDLVTSGKLIAGSYSVTVGGLPSLAADGNVGTVAVAAEKIASIKFLGTKLINITDANHAYVGYQVFNQYNEDITKSALAANLTWISSVGTATDDNAGTVTVDKGSAFASTDSVILTAIDNVSGTTANATFSYATAVTVQSVAFGTPVLPSGKTRVETGLNPAVTIPLTVTDEFGNAITSTTTINSALRFLASDSAATLSVGTDVNNNPVLNVSTASVTTAETITITVINVANGQTFTTNVSVVKPAAPDSVSFGPFTDIVASGDTSIVIPIVAADQFGNNLSTDDIANNASAFTVSSSNTSVIPNSGWAIATYGSNKGKLVFTGTVGAKGTSVVTITVAATGKSASYTVTVNDARHPNVIALPSNLATYMIQGSTVSFAASYNDQYGTAVSSTLLGANFTSQAAYKVNVTLTQASGDANCVTINNSGDIDANAAAGSNYYTLSAALGKTGSYKLAVKLIDVANSNAVISEVDKIITVVANNQSGLTYSVNDLPTLAGDQTYANTDPHAREITVVAKDASGNSYAIPSSAIFNVASSDSSVVVASQNAGNWYACGQNVTAGGTNTTNKTATLTVSVVTDNGIQQFNKTVTVSPAAPEAQSLVIYDKPVTNAYTPDSTANVINELDYGTRADATTGTTAFYLYKLDQYGVYTLEGNTNASIADGTKANGTGGFSFTNATHTFAMTGSAAAFQYEADTPVYLAFFDATSGVSTTLKVVIVSEENATATVTPSNGTGSAAAIDAGDTIAVVFNKPVLASNVTLGNISVSNSHILGASGTPATITPSGTSTVNGQTYATTFTITLGAGETLTNGDTITIAGSNIVDTAGNANTTAVTYTANATNF